MDYKKCSKCNQTKSLDFFGFDKSKKDKLTCRCKECIKQYYLETSQHKKEYYQINKEIINQKRKEYYKKRYKNNKEYYKFYNQKIEVKEKQKQYNQKPEIKEKKRKYYLDNIDYFKQKDKEIRKIIKQDPIKGPIYKLHTSINQGIRRGMKKISKSKNQISLKVLGLESWDKFREYIESQWVEGMSWNNYGKKKGCWNIDHIIPIDSINTIEEVNKINHYTNLRPLWCEENIIKKNKL